MNARVVRQTGLGYSGSIDDFGAGLLASCAGGRTVRDVIATVATELSQPVDAVADATVANVRSLIGRGFLLPDSMVG